MYTHLVELVCFDACLHCITCIVVADFSLVALRIPIGDRPLLTKIDRIDQKADGLKELVDLMKSCWHGDPTQRPNAESRCLLL